MSYNLVDPTTGDLTRVAGGTLYADAPIGAIVPFGGTAIPRGYLLCNGQVVSRADYAELFAIIGTSFGVGNGSSTFNVPDLRETLPVGVGENTNLTIAAHDVYELGQFKDDQLQGHSHDLEWSAGLPNYSKGGLYSGGGSYDSNFKGETKLTIKGVATDNENGAPRAGLTTHGKQLGVNYIIKAKHVAIPADFMNAVNKVNSYSIEEKVIGEWIDGKPIYRKVLSIPKKDYMDWQFIDATDNLNIDKVLNAVMYGTDSEGYTDCMGYALARRYPNNKFAFIIYRYALYGETLVLEYTKTTD